MSAGMSSSMRTRPCRNLWTYEQSSNQQESGVKLEEPDVQVQIQTQSTGCGSQRESGGQNPTIIDLEDELQQEMDI